EKVEGSIPFSGTSKINDLAQLIRLGFFVSAYLLTKTQKKIYPIDKRSLNCDNRDLKIFLAAHRSFAFSRLTSPSYSDTQACHSQFASFNSDHAVARRNTL
ncbi:MAG: hypothetical protein K9J49_08965, partial [Candidatus Methylopumilus sp.]|nr:hypothetical protein [Candidatus Methylopumilus sp.]